MPVSFFSFRRLLSLTMIGLATLSLLMAALPDFKVAQAQSDPPPWYDTSWIKRRPITIDNTLNPNNLVDYQVRVDVSYYSGMKNDFSDLRFTDSDGLTLIPHWAESYTASVSAAVWVRVPNIPASSTTTIYMYYENSSASDASDGTATFEFFDDFSGSILNSSKWTEDAVGNITQTVSSYFRFEDAEKSTDHYWIQDGTDTGSQHQANWTPLSQFIVEFRSGINDVTAPERGEGFLGVVAADDTMIGAAGHQDWQGLTVQATRGVVTENTASSVGNGVTQWGSSMSYKLVSNTDATNWKMINNGSTLKFYDGSGFFAEASVSSPISKLALIAGAYEPYAYLDYVQMNDIRVRKFTSPEPSVFMGSEEDYRIKGRITWWDHSWLYRKPINVTDNSGSTLSNYQVKLIIDHVASKMNPDFSDLRFTDSDQVTLIPYWVEKYTASVSAVAWVNVPSILSSGNRTIYMYYGNIAATSASNGTATFEFFDDFETVYDGPSFWTDKQALPVPRADAASAVYNGKLYVFGGYYQGPNDAKNETYEYDPLSNSWTRKADAPTARWGGVAVEYEGKIYVFGGTAYISDIDVTEVYDPATDTWTAKDNPSPSGFNYGVMGARYGDKIHLFRHGMHYEYDPATDTYTWKPSMPTPRTFGTCAVVNDEIYVIGGQHYGGSPEIGMLPNNETEAYDPIANTWTTKAPMPISKFGSERGGCVINGKIYVTHGRNWTAYFIDNYVYDPTTDSWSQKSPPIHTRASVACGVIGDKLYVVGGVHAVWGDLYLGLDYNEEYDPSTDTWIPNPWTFSDPVKVRRDASAKYEGANGLLIYEDTGTSQQYAIHSQGLFTIAIDLYWDVTDAFGVTSAQPHGRIQLADNTNPSYGSLCYYNDSGPQFSWYKDSEYTPLQNGKWNTWYPITIIWNGTASKVVINGTEYSVSAAEISSDRIYLGTIEHTQMFVDVVRVRKYTSQPPVANLGAEQEPATVKTCDSTGTEKINFNVGEAVYAKGISLKPNTDYNIYVVNHVDAWDNGNPIPTRVPGTATTVSSDNSGNIPPTVVWASAAHGKYDIVLDVLENELYDSPFDAVNSFDINTHDIAILGLLPSKTIVGSGYSMRINVTVANQGDVQEDFSLTVYANDTAINTQVVTLTNGGAANISFIWNTAGFAKGNYTISSYATQVPGETDTADNAYTYAGGTVAVATPGDVNADGIVNVIDAAGVSAHWYLGPPIGPLGYDPNFDINDDGVINIQDVALVSAYWTGPPKGPLAP